MVSRVSCVASASLPMRSYFTAEWIEAVSARFAFRGSRKESLF